MSDHSGYRYIKYHLMVKYLLETEHLTVDELFTRDLDETTVTAKSLAALPKTARLLTRLKALAVL